MSNKRRITKTEHIARLKGRNYDWPIPWEAVEALANDEDCRLISYLCPARVWTCGWGETEGVGPGMGWTEEYADERFFNEVCEYTKRVQAMLTAYANKNQLGAMVRLSYNIGLGAPGVKKGFHRSTVRKQHNLGNHLAASRAFSLFNKGRVNGVLTEMPGLVARRTREAAMYLTPTEDELPEVQVQEVQAESSLTTSPINAAGATVAGAGVLTTVTQLGDQVAPVVTQVTAIAGQVGINPGVAVGIVILAAGVVTMYWRHRQRNDGRA